MFAEATTPFFADFGVEATLAGSPVRVILDAASVDESGVVVAQPSALIDAASAPAAAPSQALVVGAVTYTVRRVEPQLPDGAIVRLILARA